MFRHFVFSLFLCLSALTAWANPAFVSQIFVPISPGVIAGANNSLWMTTLYVFNDDDVAATIECSPGPCPVIAPHSGSEIEPPFPALSHPGFWLRASAIRQGFVTGVNLSVSLRTVDSSNASNAGTEVPLVTSTDFQTGPLVLPNVPVNGHSRYLLRIYTPIPATAEVRVIGAISGNVIADETTQTFDDSTDIPAAAFAALLIKPTSLDEPLRVEVTSDQLLWAFVSVTDNVTNQFTIVAPHSPEEITVSPAKE